MGRKIRRRGASSGREKQAAALSTFSLPELSPWCVRFFVALLLALFAGLSIWEMMGDSLTFDEIFHIPAGYAYWKKREFRLNPEHPPLVKLLAAAPLLGMNLRMPATEPESAPSETNTYWRYNDFQLTFGSEFLFTQDADRIMFWARLPMVALGLLLGLFIFQWSSRLHGRPGAGLLSLSLMATEPTILAHSHYVHTDVALAAFSAMAIYFLWRFSEEAKLSHLLLASLGLGLALAAKFSAIFLVPVFFFLLIFEWPTEDSGPLFFFRAHRSLKVRIFAAAAAALLAVFTVQACYLFSLDLSLYFKGVQSVNANHDPSYPIYIHGNFFPGGVWWYPLYALLLKAPLPAMIAIAVGAISYWKNRARLRQGLIFVVLPAAVYTVAVCAFADNFGVRYMIPVTAFLLVLAGRSVFIFTAGRKGRIFAGALALWLVVSVLRVSPHYISYFNELIGGPDNAPYFLDDSNVDWGQDLKRLVEYLRQNQIKEAVLSYWGLTPPDYYARSYGIQFVPWTTKMAASADPPTGVYAISVNNLVRLKADLSFSLGAGNPNLDWLRRFRPSDRVGYSIYIYKFPQASK
jgi:4-amino-4-deoxy-L-arabinose transferase-like glycosyltransferase